MSSIHDSISDDTRAEELLASLAGVISAHVVRDDDGRIVEIHVLSAADLHPKQMVRNVESALSAGLGIEIDRRIVSVAQIRASSADTNGHVDVATSADRGASDGGPVIVSDGNGAPGSAEAEAGDAPFPDAGGRLEFVRYESHRDDGRCSCTVVLREGDVEHEGAGSGPDTAAGRAEAAARAVLEALIEARDELSLELDGAVISSSRGRSFVIIAAHALFDRSNIRLAGAAPLSRSPEEAAILAALQATNRWSG